MEASSNGDYKYLRLADVLRAKINTMPSGTRLPSFRALMKHHCVSMQTVILALKQLEDEDLIIKQPGSGTYVGEHRDVHLIVYHRSRHPSKNADAKEVSLLQAIQSSGWYMTTRRHDLTEIDSSPEPKASAHIVNQDVALTHLTFLDQILQQNVPILFLGRESGDYMVDYVTGDDWQILLTLTKHFRQLGHVQFGFLLNEPKLFEVTQRQRMLEEILKMLRLPPPVIVDCQTEWGQNSAENAYSGLKSYVQQHGPNLPFSVLLTASEDGGVPALRALHECGVSVPERCSLGTFGTKQEIQWSIPSLTSAGVLVEDWGKYAVKVLKERFDGDRSPGFGFHMPCQLSIRESSAPPHHNFLHSCAPAPRNAPINTHRIK